MTVEERAVEGAQGPRKAATLAAEPMENDFSPELLRLYYARLFPMDAFHKWLSHGHDATKAAAPKGSRDFFLRREICFTLRDDIYVRYNSFRDAEEFAASLRKRQPHKIDVGAVFTLPPRDHNAARPGTFRPVERELVFDIDLTDYDDVRTCCSGARICSKCWRFMTTSVRVLDAGLREDFGFRHIFWVYSGRRGVHCWVNDPEARVLANDARGALVDFLSVHCGNDHSTEKTNLRFPLHASLRRAYDQMLEVFADDVLGPEGQGWFDTPEGCEKILATLPSKEIATDLLRRWSPPMDVSTAQEKWDELCERIAPPREGAAAPRSQRRKSAMDYQAMDEWKVKLVFEYLYPRLDANVSKQQNHLLKSPWSVHPKTGRVCVPFLAARADDLDPFGVPTLRTLCSELDAYAQAHTNEECEATADVDKTSLGSYVNLWKRSFIDPLYSDIRRELRDQMEAETLDF